MPSSPSNHFLAAIRYVTEDGQQFKILAVIDEYTRECLALEVGRSFTADDVVSTLRYLFALRGRPENIRSDNYRSTGRCLLQDASHSRRSFAAYH